MNGNPRDTESILQQALDGIRDDAPAAADERAAAERVWQRLADELAARPQDAEQRHRIRDCADFQALIPAHLEGRLSEPKHLLLQDHLSECVPCRRALAEARGARRRASGEPAMADERGAWSTWTWRLAAAAVIVVALVGLSVQTDVFTLRTGGLVFIEAVDGELFRVSQDGTAPVGAGEALSFQDTKLLRTGKDSRAMLRLADDSRVEVNERAELTVFERRKLWSRGRGDTVIDLDRGSVIVEAAEQGTDRLFVDTPEARVAVTGTVFAVNHGMKGSRVSVIEGQVRVASAGRSGLLHPGEQATSRAGLGKVPIAEEIAWSRQLDKHLALLREFETLGREIDAQIGGPAQRFDTTLLDRAPSGTAVYVGIPNLSDTLGQAYDLMQQKVAANDLLREWWDESVVESGADRHIATAMDKIRSYGRQLDEEIVVTVAGIGSEQPSVLLLTRLRDPAAFRALVEDELAAWRDRTGGQGLPEIAVLDDLSAPPPSSDLYLSIAGEFLAVSPEIGPLREFAGILQQGGPSAFHGTAFHDRLAALYAEGVEWVIGVDVEALRRAGLSASEEETARLEGLGILDLQHVIAERKEYDGRGENRAVLSFDRQRRGVASWLAEPAPMGSLGFISPNAYFAGAFVMREPAEVVEELIRFFGTADPEFQAGLEQFQREHGIDVRDDLAAALGGEFAFAIDGPVLPKPSLKLVLEVYDPARLQATLEWATGRVNDLLREAGKQGLQIAESDSGGRTWYELRSLDTGISAHYVYVDGYLVAAASRTLLDRALQYRASGLSITSSPKFTALVPHDARINFSGFVFQDWSSAVGPLAERLRDMAAGDGDGEPPFLGPLGAFGGANLTLAYGEPSSITLVNTSEGGLLGRSLTSILSLQSLLRVQEWVGEAAREHERRGDGTGSGSRG